MIAKAVAIRSLTLATNTWTAVDPPIGCSRITLENMDTANAVRVRTNTDDSSTEKTLPASAEITFASAETAFNPGQHVCYLQATSGSGPVVVSYVR